MINLYNYIGIKQDKNLLDCLTPIYLLYPNLPKYNYDLDFEHIDKCFKNHFFEATDLKVNDVIVIGNFAKQQIHFGIYAGNDKFFHCCNDQGLRVSKLSIYKVIKVYRRYEKG